MKKSLLLCPLALELEFLRERFKEKAFVFREEQVGPIKVFHVDELNLILAPAGHGKTQFAIQTQYLIGHFKVVRAVFCVGCAGAIDDKLMVGDVVVAEKTLEHDFRLKFISKPMPEFAGDSSMLQKFSLVKVNEFKIHFGKIASGDEDIIDDVRAGEVRLQTGALAVAWEGAGGARAAKFNKIAFLEVRGITDRADSSTPDNFKEKLKIAMSNVCDVIMLANIF